MTTYRLKLIPVLAGALCATAVLLGAKLVCPPLSWVIVASPVGLLLLGAKFYRE